MQLTEILKPGQNPLPKPKNDAAVSHLSTDLKDKPRGVQLVRMRVVNRCTKNLQVLNNTVPPGEWEISVHKDEAHKVDAMIEKDRAALDHARGQYLRDIMAAVHEKAGFDGDVNELMRAVEDGTARPDIMDAIKSVLDETVLSVEGVFHRSMKRDVRPLDAAEVVAGSEHDEPKAAEQKAEQNRLADAMGQALGKFLSAAQGGNQQSGGQHRK